MHRGARGRLKYEYAPPRFAEDSGTEDAEPVVFAATFAAADKEDGEEASTHDVPPFPHPAATCTAASADAAVAETTGAAAATPTPTPPSSDADDDDDDDDDDFFELDFARRFAAGPVLQSLV